jgi:hypothetical protein
MFTEIQLKSVEKIESLLKEAQEIAKNELGLDNIFYNERFVELFMAAKLNHSYGNNTQGGDAFEVDINKPTEYKAINLRNKSKNSSFQFHWLSDNKVEKYRQTQNMYFAVRDGITIKEIYKVDSKKIMPYIDKKATGSSNINGHVSFNEKKLVEVFRPEKVYTSLKNN